MAGRWLSITATAVISERLLRLRGVGNTVPLDDAGFERFWAYVRALVADP